MLLELFGAPTNIMITIKRTKHVVTVIQLVLDQIVQEMELLTAILATLSAVAYQVANMR